MTKLQLQKLTVAQIKALAKANDIKIGSNDTKDMLISKVAGKKLQIDDVKKAMNSPKAKMKTNPKKAVQRAKGPSTKEFSKLDITKVARTGRQELILKAAGYRLEVIAIEVSKLESKLNKARTPERVKAIKSKIAKLGVEKEDIRFIIYEITEKDSRKSYRIAGESFISPRIKKAKLAQKKAATKLAKLDAEQIKAAKRGNNDRVREIKKEMEEITKEYNSHQETLHATSASKSTAIKVRGLNAFYGSKQALYNVNIDFPRNQIISIIGPSGCGKSTFLRTLNKINDEIASFKTNGHIIFDGNIDIVKGVNTDTGDRVDNAEIRTRIGMVFQQPNPFPMSIYKNLTYGPKINGVKNKAILNELVEKSLKAAALWNEVGSDLKKLGTALSGGQQQRLCIARTLANQPDVILMDEPTSALDPIAAKKVEDTILKLKENYTIIMVTHSMAQAKRISDKTAFFYEGELIEYGDTDKMFSKPEHKRTAEYTSGKFG